MPSPLKVRAARALKQLELSFPPIIVVASHCEANCPSGSELESQARELLRAFGAHKLAREIRVEWNPRLKTCAGRTDYREKLISLNPLLRDVRAGLAPNKDDADSAERAPHKLDCLKQSSSSNGAEGVLKRSQTRGLVCDEVDRTLRHELAHLLAQWRVGRRRIAPHGKEWRQACRDLGIADEARCHNLPFVTESFPPRYVYRCPNCKEEFPRVRRIRRAIACLACCRKHNGGDFDPRFRLKLIR
jgi:predicted SprT family Zn-dependent metalloprotease